jgi:uncharacterized protein (TIGR03067 family)
MRLKWLGVVAIGLLIAADDAEKDDTVKDKESLKGTWIVQSSERDGQADERSKDATVTFDGDSVTVMTKDKEQKATFTLDATKKPKTIDFTPSEESEKDKVVLGIYSLDKDELKVCFTSRPGDERPTEFSAKEGTGHHLIVLKRKK